MGWQFVGRSEQVERIRFRLDECAPEPLVVVGEPGIGRTSVVRKALEQLDPARDALIEVLRGDDTPFSSLRHLLPAQDQERRSGQVAVREVADAVVAGAAGKRPVLVADDAHLADHASMLVLQHLNRHAGAFLLLTHPEPHRLPDSHDPVDCLRYERGIQTMRLPSLSTDEVGVVLACLMDGPVRHATTDALHAATGGNPGLLHDIVVRQDLAGRMVRRDGRWQLGDSPRGDGTALTCRGTAHLLDAVGTAWSALAMDRVEDLCRLATWSGVGADIALVKAAVLLLRGHPDHAVTVLDDYGDGSPQEQLLRSMCVAFGLNRPAEAIALLAEAAARSGTHRHCHLAYQAWLLAATGRTADARAVLAGIDHREDREAALFVHTAKAITVLGTGKGAEAIAHLRRALVLAEGGRTALPWMAPYLRAYLIDALLLAGRITEATTMASEFHAAAPTCGWKVAVAMAALTTTSLEPDTPTIKA